MNRKKAKQKPKFRLTKFDWDNDENCKTIYFDDYDQAEKTADNIKLKEYEDIVIFDNKTGDELYFRDIEH